MSGLEGAVAIVTGGTQGLGAAIAHRFAEGGAAGIVTCGRNADKGRAVAQAINDATGVPVRFVEADLAEVAAASAVVAEADAAFGRIDVLVNAAGLTDRGGILDTDPDLFDRMIAVNTRAPFFLMQEAARRMVREGIAGRIVNIGSVSGHAGQPFITPYCVSKGALATLTRNAAFALMRNRIRVNQLDIGWMASEGEDRIQREYHGADDDWLDTAAAAMPFGRLLDPTEVAEAAAFLAGSESGMMTGAVIPFDQSVRGGFAGAAPTPEGAVTWPD